MGNAQEEIRVTIDAARKQIELSDALDRLHKNKDFKHIIGELYLGKEPARLTFLLSDPSQQMPEQRDAIIKSLQGVAELHGFFRKIEQGTIAARRTLEEHLALEADEEV